MKKLRILVSIAVVFLWFTAWSAPRNLEQARQTARNFYVQHAKAKASISDEDFVLVYPRAVKSGSAQAPLYVFNLSEEKGFVMVNGEDDLRPVLGYSLSGGFPTDVLPANLQYWLDTYRKQIEAYQEAVKNGTMPGNTEFSNAYPKADASAVGPLLENYAEGAINYNQGEPYNLLCPDPNETGSPTVTGCVATAMAQIARYHKHPAQGTGHISYTAAKLGIDINHDFTDRYDWGNMLCDYNGDPSSYTQEQKKAIATLMRDIGYASRMNYGYDESGANGLYALAGMQQYMGYSKAAEMSYREYFTDRQWTALLISEIDAGRPLYYEGCDNETNAGHAFVCDGYQADDYFHFNWGWGAWGNGWYWINHLVPTQTGTGAGNGRYNDGQGVSVKFKPDDGEVPAGGNLYYQDYGQAPDRKSFACQTGSYKKDAALSCTAYSFWNLSPRTLTIDIGVVYWGQDGSFVKAVVDPDNQSVALESYYGWTDLNFTINPGKDVPAGTYKISLGSRCAGSAQWEEVKAQRGYTYAYTVTVHEDGYEVEELKNIQVATPDIDQPEGMFLDSIEVAITCATPGASILYSLDGSVPSLPYTQPLVLKESATLKAIAEKEGMEASDEVRAVYTCARETLKKYTSVANLRELKQNGENDTYYRITGQVTVTFAASNYADLYIEDSTGGMRISDYPGQYRTKYRIGDVLENLCGRFQRGEATESILEVPEGESIPVFEPMAQTVPHAKKTSMAQIEQNAEAYACTLVEIENVRLENWEEGMTWDRFQDYNAYQGDVNFYISSYYSSGQPYFNEKIPSTFTLRGIVRDGRIYPRTQSDIRGEGDPLPETYTLTVVASPSEGGTVSGGGTYESGMKITLRAKAADEWMFVRWSDDNTQATRTVTVTEDTTYTAYFKRANAPETYTLTINASPSEGGTVSGGGTYEIGKEATLKATANNGWKFTRWNDNNKQTTRTVTVTEDATYTAYFEKANVPETYTLTVVASPIEGGTVSGDGTYESGEEATLNAKANNGWKFTRWNDNNTQATRTVTVTEDATYTAYFERITARETESLSQIKIYPNPSEGLFIVETGLALKAEVYDNLGILHGAYRWNQAGKHTVDLRPCTPGVYHLRLSSSTFTQTVKLMVK